MKKTKQKFYKKVKKKSEKRPLKVKLSQVKRLMTFCLRSVTLGEKKYKKKKLKKNKIRLHPNIVLLTLAFKGL